jgi:16S rRNA (uracil1498-N3)-methyltransferase
VYHFFVTTGQIDDTHCHITGSDVNHIKNVLRMKPGEKITLRDGISRSYICEIETLDNEEVTARIISVEDDHSELPARLYLFQGLPKSDKMELIIQKAVELGAYEIIPVSTRRCVVKLDAKKADTKVKRWNTIAESAAKQSGRAFIPKVTEVMTWKQALAYAADFDINLIPYELAEGMADTKTQISRIAPGMQVGIFIGPEGGYDTAEVEAATSQGLHPITLGPRILRTETAGMTTLSIIMYHLEQ